MHDLKLSKLKEGFVIETNSPDIYNLRLSSKKKVTNINQIEPNKWLIPFSLIYQILQQTDELRAYIFYGEKNTQILADNYYVSILSDSLMELYNKDNFYLYFANDGFLRIIKKQRPSASSYYKDSKITSIKQETINSIRFNITVSSNILSTSEIDFVISSRKDSVEWSTPLKIKSSSRNNKNNYLTQATVLIENPAKILFDMISNFDYDDFNLSIFDYWIRIRVKEQLLTDYRFRLKGPDNLSDTMWFKLNEQQMFAVTWYRTTLGNISNRISVLDNDSYTILTTRKLTNTVEREKKPIILICEYPYKAQENGYFFFKYLMENQNQVLPYYIISENSPDIDRLEPYKSNVALYKSPKHIELFYKANILAHTHTPNYVLPAYTSNEINHLEKNIHTIFLQHGILGFRDLEYMYGRKSHPNLINNFLVSSQRELKVVRDELYYPEEDIKITGLARFDSLLQGNTLSRRLSLRTKILIMPTWRKGQETFTDELFLETPFYKAFSSLITNPQFKKIARMRNLTINLYLHNNFQKFSHLFESDFVSIIRANETTVQELLKNHGVLITDFSSIGLDFAIQHKPVLYYQFPEELQDQSDRAKGNSFLPGPVFVDQNTLLQALYKKTLLNTLSHTYKKKLKNDIYKYHDCNACKRIYDYIISLIDNNKIEL